MNQESSNPMKQVPVSERALFQRIQRALQAEGRGEVLKQCRPTSRWFNDLGRYYGVDSNNRISFAHKDLEELAKEMKVLQPWEVYEPSKPVLHVEYAHAHKIFNLCGVLGPALAGIHQDQILPSDITKLLQQSRELVLLLEGTTQS